MVPGLLSAGLPRAPTNAPPSERVPPHARRRGDDGPSEVAIATLSGEVHQPQHQLGQRPRFEPPASPQFGNWHADDSNPSSPRSPHVACPSSSSSPTPSLGSTAPPAPVSLASAQSVPALARDCDEIEVQLKELRAALGATSDSRQAARLWARIGTLQQRRKCFEEARHAYSTAVQLDGEAQHGSLANLAQLEAHAGNVQMACQFLERAICIDPTNSAYQAFRQWLTKDDSASPARVEG